MDEANDRMGLLMLLDDVGLLLSTFGVLVLYNLVTAEGLSTSYLIVCLFFTGIKILLTGIADITGIAKKLWISIVFILVADGAIILINRFMAFGLSTRMLLLTTVIDVIVIIAALLIWRKIVGKSVLEEEKARSEWISQEQPADRGVFAEESAIAQRPAEQTSAFDSLFESEPQTERQTADFSELFDSLATQIAENEKKNKAVPIFEEDNDVITVAEENDLPGEEPDMSEEDVAEESVPEEPEQTKEAEEAPVLTDEGDTLLEEAEEKIEEETPEELVDSISDEGFDFVAQKTADDLFKEIGAVEQLQEETQKQEDLIVDETSEDLEEPEVSEEDAKSEDISADLDQTQRIESEICNELDTIYSRMLQTANRSQLLQHSVSHFSEEIESMPEITTESDIVESGRLIRSKLRTIIDKQFVMDDVLQEVIETSEKINQRVKKLNEIEAKLKAREEALNEKEQAAASEFDAFTSPLVELDQTVLEERFKTEPEEKPNTSASDQKEVSVKNPIHLETNDFDILIDEADFELVRQYLQEHPDQSL